MEPLHGLEWDSPHPNFILSICLLLGKTFSFLSFHSLLPMQYSALVPFAFTPETTSSGPECACLSCVTLGAWRLLYRLLWHWLKFRCKEGTFVAVIRVSA